MAVEPYIFGHLCPASDTLLVKGSVMDAVRCRPWSDRSFDIARLSGWCVHPGLKVLN